MPTRSAPTAQKANLRWGFKVGTSHRRVHTFKDASTQSLRFLARELPELRVVGVGHVGMTQPKTPVIQTNERVRSLEIDVVPEYDKRAAAVFGADSACSIGQHQSAYPHSS